MQNFRRISILMALVLTCSAALRAQDSKQQIPPKRKFKHNTKIQTKYDSAKDQTMVYIDPYHHSGPVPYFELLENAVVTAAFRYPGKTLTATPETVELGIITNSNIGWFFGENKDLLIFADGEQVFKGPLTVVSKNKARGSVYVEVVSAILPTDAFLKIANSKTVEMKAGPHVQFKLVTENLEAFSDLASHMKP